MSESDANLLEASGLPVFFDAGAAADLGLELPANRHGQTVRTWARSLTVMQKEALVVSAPSGRAWRLASDEGPYLDGFDTAPCPLAFFTTGMVASYMTEIVALADQRDIGIDDIELVIDNRYTMQGSALDGSMTGGALPVELEARIASNTDDVTLEALLTEAVRASPVDGLLRGELTSLFSLKVGNESLATGKVGAIEALDVPGPTRLFEGLVPAAGRGRDPGLIRKLDETDVVRGVAGGAGSSLKSSQKRELHVRGTCRLLADGRKEIEQELFAPIGSKFRFLSDETAESGGTGRAPDAASYMAAGIAFCFMTQLGRYAKILKKHLASYDVIQDTHFPPGAASGSGGAPGAADAVETHVYLDTNEGEEFARTTVDMGEQTCFLHAFCRTPLETRVRLTRT